MWILTLNLDLSSDFLHQEKQTFDFFHAGLMGTVLRDGY